RVRLRFAREMHLSLLHIDRDYEILVLDGERDDRRGRPRLGPSLLGATILCFAEMELERLRLRCSRIDPGDRIAATSTRRCRWLNARRIYPALEIQRVFCAPRRHCDAPAIRVAQVHMLCAVRE